MIEGVQNTKDAEVTEDLRSYLNKWKKLLNQLKTKVNEFKTMSKCDLRTRISSEEHYRLAELLNELEDVRNYIFNNKDQLSLKFEIEYKKLLERHLELARRDAAIWEDVDRDRESLETMYR